MLGEILTPDTGPDAEARGWGLPALPVVADAGYGDATGFRLGLAERGLSYVVAVKPTTSAYPGAATPELVPYTGRGRPPVPRYRDPSTNLKALVLAAGRAAGRRVTWRHGSRNSTDNPTAALRSRVTSHEVV